MNPLKMDVLKNTRLCQILSFVIVTYKCYKTENEILNTNYKTFRFMVPYIVVIT